MKKIYMLLIACILGFPMLAQNPMNVLFVNDNGVNPDNTATMLQLFDNAQISYTVFDAVAEMRSPELLEMQNFNLVVWYLSSDGVGRYFWNGDDSDNNNLRLYLEQGGMLWVIGTDFMYDRYATPYTFAQGDFVFDYLGVSEYHAQAYADDGFEGVPQLDLVEGLDWLSLNPVSWVFTTLWYVDAIAPTQNAQALYMMGPATYVFSDYASAIMKNASGYQTISFFFDMALIDTQANRQILFNDIMNYFDGLVSTDEIGFNSHQLRVSPNPAANFISIDYGKANSGTMTAKILDLTGKVMLEKIVRSDDNRLDISELPNGVYFIRMDAKTHKLIVRK